MKYPKLSSFASLSIFSLGLFLQASTHNVLKALIACCFVMVLTFQNQRNPGQRTPGKNHKREKVVLHYWPPYIKDSARAKHKPAKITHAAGTAGKNHKLPVCEANKAPTYNAGTMPTTAIVASMK
jgi:hypothetical protein